MIPSRNIRSLVKEFESFQEVAYKDGNAYSIGYGNSFYADGRPVKYGDRISKTEGERLFNAVFNQFAVQVSQLVTARINQNQFDALVSFAYNVGVNAFRGSGLLKKVNANPADPAIRAEFDKWVYSKGIKVSGLVKRHKREADYYFSNSESRINSSMLAGFLLIPAFVIFKRLSS